MIDARDAAAFLTGAAALKWWQWTTRRDRPRDPAAEHIARKNVYARFARLTRRIAGLRERVTGRRMPVGWEEETARHWADRVPRMWL